MVFLRSREVFRFKQFTVHQNRTTMKVGTDGVLLGAWVEVKGNESHILDIGAGTGVIALMMAQRSKAKVDGVEIEHSSAEQAAENVKLSPWAERVTIYHTPIQEFSPQQKYDLILSNPPYFVDSLLSPSSARSTARHTTDLSFNELAESVVRLLSIDGRFALILPTTEGQLFDVAANRVGLKLLRRVMVSTSRGSAPKRVMSEYSPAFAGECVIEQLTIGSHDQQYTDEYRELTREFYLKF
ncbi:MAG: methyltransferase [Rikenellaceae bacterium]